MKKLLLLLVLSLSGISASAQMAYTPVEGNLTDVRVAFGSLAPTPLRGRRTESILEGQPATPELFERAEQAADEEVRPISDVRGSDCYRRALARVFLRRLLDG